MLQPSKTLGIDFGTSNSAAGILRDGRAHLLEVESGKFTLPTSVFFDFESRKTVFGTPANQALIEGHDGRFMRALKSVLGTSLMREKRMLMGERLDFIDITARFLARLKARAEEGYNQEFDHALSGRPVLFHSANAGRNVQALKDLQECYQRAGFKGVEFMFEPEAAALANHQHMARDTLGLVVDIGGGTSDFTLFKLGEGAAIDIIASHGVRVGGTDFDRKLSIDHVMPLLGKGGEIRNTFGGDTAIAPNTVFNNLATWEKIPFLYSPEIRSSVKDLQKFAVNKVLFNRLAEVLDSQLGHDLAFNVERAKIAANEGIGASIDMRLVERDLETHLSSAEIAGSLNGLVGKIETASAEILAQAGCRADDVGSLIFVGGSSQMQVVETALRAAFPAAIPHKTSALTAVVDGLAIASGR